MSRQNQHRVSPEERMASRQKIWRRLRRGLLAIAVTGGVAGSGWWLNDNFAVNQWQVDGDIALKMTIEKKLSAMADKSYLQTRPALLHDQWLATIPDLADVQITRILPDTLHITAIAREPVALWEDESGVIHLVDGKGHSYRPLRQGESPDLPLLRISSSELEQAHLLLQAFNLQQVRDMKNLSEVRSSDTAWMVYFNNGERWLLPHHREAAVFSRLGSILSQPRWHKRSWRIDARTSSRWFIRPAKQGGVI
ncbi:MAG TPA: cell division protein FtsQ/DivIB [Mariprofundaceae bacterium]|nr:cell division protein FtsQ/DivIB [Mariprofundaceae bacterium]